MSKSPQIEIVSKLYNGKDELNAKVQNAKI